MTIALLKRRRDVNRQKLAVLAFLAKQADVDEWPERLEDLMKKPDALGNEGFIKTLVQEVVQDVALLGKLPKVVHPAVTTATKQAEEKPVAEQKPAEAKTSTKRERAGESD